MKKIFELVAILICFLVFPFSGCENGYTSDEIVEMQETLASFDDNPNFALTYFDTIWLQDRKIIVDELTYEGTQIDRLLGCADEYFYASVLVKKATRNYTMSILQVDYDTLEMVEIGCVENLKESHTVSCRLVGDKIYFSDADKYCVYDINSGVQEWFDYDHDAFWKRAPGQYIFDIESDRKDSVITVTENATGEKKQVSWKNDLDMTEEGKYIQKFSEQAIWVNASFIDATERNGKCYFLGVLPLDAMVIEHQAVIFTYDFATEEVSYYSSLFYELYGYPSLEIINR